MSNKRIQIQITEEMKNKMTIARGYCGLKQNEFIKEAINEKINNIMDNQINK